MALLAAAGCGPCAPSSPAPPDAGPPPAPLAPPDLLPPAKPWAFREVRGLPTVAAPRGCRFRAPTLRAEVPPTTGFLAERGSLGALLVADATDDASRLLGVSAMRFDAAGAVAEQRPLPWLTPAAAPRLARTAAGGWLATFGDRGGAGAQRLGLWREGATELVGEGDGFEAVDLRCEGGACALLTSRLGRAAMAGAELWLGAADAPIAGWKRAVIEPPEGAAGAHPLAIAGVEPPAQGGAGPAAAVVALGARGQVLLFRADAAGAQPLGRVDAPHGALDVIALAAPTAMLHATPVDEEGCLRLGQEPGGGDPEVDPEEDIEAVPEEDREAVREQGALPPAPGVGRARLRFAQGERVADVKLAAPPLQGALRRLRQGALATWIAPLACGAERRVVYGVRLDEAGQLAGEVIPVADAERYAVASAGDEVDLWLQREGAVTWARLRCGEGGP